MLRFEKVVFSYPDGTVAIDNVSFELSEGEFVFIIGPNGSGKTTILKLLLAKYFPQKGEIIFDGKKIKELKGWERQLLRQKIGVVFQGRNLIPELNIEENLSLRLELAGMDKKERERRLTEIVDRFNLKDKLKYFPSQLSSGEKRKIALARALSLEPLMVFADEPTANLDPLASLEIMTELVRINKEGTLVVVTTHNKELVDKFRYRVLSLERGKLVKDIQEGKYVLT